MRKIALLLLLMITLSSCLIYLPNKYCHRNSDDDELFGPKYPDYRTTSVYIPAIETFPRNTIFCEEIYHEQIDPSTPDDTLYQYQYFWPDGNCLLSSVIDADSARKRGADLHVNNQARYQGKYQLSNDTLITEYFIGGSPNSYLITTYLLVADSAEFLTIGDRFPNRSKIKYPGWMQSRYDRNMYKLDVDPTQVMKWQPNW